MQGYVVRAAMKAGVVIASAVSIGMAGAASANDMRNPAAAPGWTGFYAGINAGYGWNSQTASFTGLEPTVYVPAVGIFYPGFGTQIPGSMDVASKGLLGGIQAGYNYQIERTVLGVEADFALADVHGSNSYYFVSNAVGPPNITTVQASRLEWLSTLRGRIGFLATPSLLPFVSGGLAVGRAVISTTTAASTNSFGAPADCTPGSPVASFICSTGTSAKTLVGWTAGAGIEAAVARNWSVKAEYLHYDLGSVSYTDTMYAFQGLIGTPAMQSSTNVKGDIVRVGLNYLVN